MYFELLRKRYLSPDEGGSGGAAFVPLSDIEAEEEQTPPSDPAKKTPDLDEEAKKQAAAEAEEAKRKEQEEADAKKAEEEAAAQQQQQNQQPNEDDTNFWDDVDALRGEALDVDFGDIDPNTPEGALIYEKAARLDEMNKFEEYLEKTYPRAYAFLAHMMDGGKEEDFFKIAGDPATLPTESELESDIDKQKAVITQNLKAKGLSDKIISTTIKQLITDDELEEASKDALKEEVKRRDDGVAAVKKANDDAVAERQKNIDQMTRYVGEVASTGKLGNITIPEKDRVPFAKAVNQSIRYENGKFYATTELTQENIMDVFREKFFTYKGGKLDDLIDKAARTANTNRLKRTIDNTQQKKPLGSGQGADSSAVMLGAMDE